MSQARNQSLDLRTQGRSEGRSTGNNLKTARKLSGSPAQPETPTDGHLAGLLTYASANFERLPGSSRPFTPTSGANGDPPVACCSSSQRIQLRGSGGFSPRFPLTRWEKVIVDEEHRRQARPENANLGFRGERGLLTTKTGRGTEVSRPMQV